jgi:hypothetical protein
MVLIVEADTDDSSDIRNWWSDAHTVIYERQLIDIDFGDLFDEQPKSNPKVRVAHQPGAMRPPLRSVYRCI